MKKFSQKSLLELGKCYVYGLIDTRTNKIFYIGKGSNNRVFDHEYESLKHPDSKKLKLATIKEIKDAGYEIKKVILHSGLTEDEAYAAEAALINAFNYIENTGLTNDQAGHHSKEAYTVEDFEKWFGAEELTKDNIKHNLFIVKINKTYNKDMTEQEIYEIVRGCWKGNKPYKKERLNKVDYVLGVYNNLVVGVYKPSVWEYVKDNPLDMPDRDKGKVGLEDRVYFRDYSFENNKEKDENQLYYLHKSITTVSQIPNYM